MRTRLKADDPHVRPPVEDVTGDGLGVKDRAAVKRSAHETKALFRAAVVEVREGGIDFVLRDHRETSWVNGGLVLSADMHSQIKSNE